MATKGYKGLKRAINGRDGRDGRDALEMNYVYDLIHEANIYGFWLTLWKHFKFFLVGGQNV